MNKNQKGWKMEDRHAYLILAHNEFTILDVLIQMLDDSRNDIYIHFDQKTKDIPPLKTKFSKLQILSNRVNVAWGDVSVIEAEYELFTESSEQGPYAYYHLLSGVDLPLKSQDNIHAFFRQYRGKEFIGFSNYDYAKEVDRKVNYHHIFAKDFRKTKAFSNQVKAACRAIFLRIQMYLGMKRFPLVEFKKGTQWVSVTHGFVSKLLAERNLVLSMYKNTFCSDEIYKQTICWHSEFRSNLYSSSDEGQGAMRAIRWKDGALYDWTDTDFADLMNSEKLFARKFNSQNMKVVMQIHNSINL